MHVSLAVLVQVLPFVAPFVARRDAIRSFRHAMAEHVAGHALAAMSAALAEQLIDVRRSLTRPRHAIPGDGHCQFRSVTTQCPEYGYTAHSRLRREVVDHVLGNCDHFLHLFTGNQQRRLAE